MVTMMLRHCVFFGSRISPKPCSRFCLLFLLPGEKIKIRNSRRSGKIFIQKSQFHWTVLPLCLGIIQDWIYWTQISTLPTVSDKENDGRRKRNVFHWDKTMREQHDLIDIAHVVSQIKARIIGCCWSNPRFLYLAMSSPAQKQQFQMGEKVLHKELRVEMHPSLLDLSSIDGCSQCFSPLKGGFHYEIVVPPHWWAGVVPNGF